MPLLDSLANLDPDQLKSLLGRVDEITAQGLLPQLYAEVAKRCADNGLLYLKFVRTLDEADRETPVKTFPDRPYVEPIWTALARSKRVTWAKSRQMSASWLLVAYCTWVARFRPYQAIYWQAQKDDDANAMVALPGQAMGRAQFIEAHLPHWLQQQVKSAEGRLTYPNGSFIQALAGGANQIRGRVFSLYVGDEFAFQEEARGVYTSIAPLVQKGSQIILVSTPNGGPPNTFARLFHGLHEASASA